MYVFSVMVSFNFVVKHSCILPPRAPRGRAREIDVMRDMSRATRKRGTNAVTSGPYSDPVWPYSYRHGDATARARCRSRDHPVC